MIHFRRGACDKQKVVQLQKHTQTTNIAHLISGALPIPHSCTRTVSESLLSRSERLTQELFGSSDLARTAVAETQDTRNGGKQASLWPLCHHFYLSSGTTLQRRYQYTVLILQSMEKTSYLSLFFQCLSTLAGCTLRDALNK